VAGVNV